MVSVIRNDFSIKRGKSEGVRVVEFSKTRAVRRPIEPILPLRKCPATARSGRGVFLLLLSDRRVLQAGSLEHMGATQARHIRWTTNAHERLELKGAGVGVDRLRGFMISIKWFLVSLLLTRICAQ